MNALRKSLIAAAVIAGWMSTASVASAAGNVTQKKVAGIQILGSTSAPYAFIIFEGGVSGSSPSCATFPQLGMYVSLSNNHGRSILSVAMSAMLAGTKVSAVGSGSCSTPSGSAPFENLAVLTAHPS